MNTAVLGITQKIPYAIVLIMDLVLRGEDMLASSKEYLQALRTGNYLLFLEWPRFIVHHYQHAGRTASNGDELIDLLVFEWLNNDYSEGDAKLVALLYKLHDIEPKPLSGDLDYSLISISIAVLQCMIFQSTNLQSTILSKEKMTKREVIDFMIKNSIEPPLFERSLSTQQSQFAKWVDLITTSQLDKVLAKIKPIIDLRQSVMTYLNVLEQSTLGKDDLKTTRISVLQRLSLYIHEQTELTERVRQEVDSYTTKMWDLGPHKFEETHLMSITPFPIMKTTWRFVTDLGIGFFRLFEAPTSEPASAEPKANLKT